MSVTIDVIISYIIINIYIRDLIHIYIYMSYVKPIVNVYYTACINIYIGGSINGGTPKRMVYSGKV